MPLRAYYNDNEPTCVAWLLELMREGLIPEGDVDDRSIHDVKAEDLKCYTEKHFFAGIGGWPYALQLAGWPTNEPVWTGSCPCQPYSVAGKGAGDDDPRNLWPVWRELILKCRPSTVFGEQVASKAGREWLAGVRADLEAMGYVVGAADLCAAGVGALHRRQRLWWVADSSSVRRQGGKPPQKQSWSWEQLERLVQAEIQLSVPTGQHRALADGVSNRMGRLSGYGGAIVPQLAAEFIAAYLDCRR